ncbi:MAG: VCBS repeat-containing protein [Holophagales bacterium]|nr:VCBS repeat-containing protein [Holophagales bacterium]MYH25275.1 VCBS repeat-containing protein [Holophagales bacterium]
MKRRATVPDERRHRPARISLLAMRVCLSGCMMPVAVHASSEPPAAFAPSRHELVVDVAERLTVLTGFLTGRPVADVAAVHLDGDGDRRLRVLSFVDGDWSTAAEATLRAEVSFVDVAGIDGRDRLIAYGGGRLTWFDLESATERDLVAVTSDFRESARGEVLHVDMTRDVNGDGRDDLVLAHGHGFHVLVQMPAGRFAEPVTVGPTSGLDRVYGADGYRYHPWDEGGRIHEMDYDLDGRSDLVFWNDGRFEVHLQTEQGLFSPEARTFTTGIAFDSDQIASLAAPEGIRRRRMDHMPEGESSGRVLHSLTDMNGDGVTDLVVFSLKGSSLWKMHSSYEVYPGAPGPGGNVEFAPEPGAVVESEGIVSGIDRHDFDRDGQVDVVVTAFEPTVFSAIRVLVMSILTGAGSFDLEMFRMEDGRYGDRPNAVRQIRPRTPRRSGERAFWPAVRMGDMNGDGRSDVLIARNRKMLHVHLGVPGPGLLAKKPQRIAIPVPEDEEYTWLTDLNQDGKQDVLMHHTSTTEPHRLVVLMSR